MAKGTPPDSPRRAQAESGDRRAPNAARARKKTQEREKRPEKRELVKPVLVGDRNHNRQSIVVKRPQNIGIYLAARRMTP